jgi:zinc D-Ala-D-Ala carboxypeptidase
MQFPYLSTLAFAVLGWQCQPNAPAPVPAPLQARSALAPPAAAADSVPKTPAPEVDADYLLGKFDPAQHPDFVSVGKPYSDKPGMSMRREAFEAFVKMWETAQKDGVTLKIISSTRNFDRQKEIWEGKWTRFAKDAPAERARALKILEYSSMPGASRHHWGTDIDLNDLNNPSFEPGGTYHKVYRWLDAHAAEYGFCQPYTPKGENRPNGYNEERWHWSYTPLSAPFLKQYLKLLSNADFKGFKGSEIAKELDVVENYVNGINETCKKQ